MGTFARQDQRGGTRVSRGGTARNARAAVPAPDADPADQPDQHQFGRPAGIAYGGQGDHSGAEDRAGEHPASPARPPDDSLSH
jgi:hypothetical protein